MEPEFAGAGKPGSAGCFLTYRAESGEPAILVNINFRSRALDEAVGEFVELAAAAGVQTKTFIDCSRNKPDAAFFIGSGKVEEMRRIVAEQKIKVIIFNHALSPRQERNLSNACRCRVIDRVALILDIFAQRARTFEGKLQVELAQLRHLSTRLIRGWEHLERQKGGIGLRGPGETQLEVDRRWLGRRMNTIKARLEKVKRQHQLGRKRRIRSRLPVVSLVGYTNVGKSTLFNRLTDAGVYAENKLFATLDPTFRRLEVAPFMPVILTDTVGFIRRLPDDLLDTFQATLDEIRAADLLLHVVDIGGGECRDDQIEQVNSILGRLDAGSTPQIMVYNKIDQHPKTRPGGAINKDGRDENRVFGSVWCSAGNGQGIDELLDVIAGFVRRQRQGESAPMAAAETWQSACVRS